MKIENPELNYNDDVDARLWEFIDGFSTPAEKSIIEKLISENSEWKARYAELFEIHQLIQSTELEQPSLRFTKNVMDEIAMLHIAPATKKYINNKIIYGIAGFFITVIVSFLVYGISQIDWSAGNSSINAFGLDLGSVDYSLMFNNTFVNVFMMCNVILGLLLLDRYLNSKRKDLSKAGY